MSAPSVPMVRQTAGAGAARAAARRRNLQRGMGPSRRPGWLTYTILSGALLISALPLYYAILLASSDAATIARNPIPSLIPQGNLWDNLMRVFGSDINFWTSVVNSSIVAVIVSA